MILKAIVPLHGVQDRAHPPFTERALGLALSPLQDTYVKALVEACHHAAGLLPAVQAYWTAVVQLCGHALLVGWGKLGMTSWSVTLLQQQQQKESC